MILIFGILSALLTNIVTSLLFDESNYFAKHTWAQAVSLWIAGAAGWFLGRYLNGRPARVVIDKATGQEVLVKPKHDLMFIKLEYWGAIFCVIGLAVLIRGALKH